MYTEFLPISRQEMIEKGSSRAALDAAVNIIKKNKPELLASYKGPETEVEIIETEEEKKPSIVIAFTSEDDTLWSLAKKYGVSTEKIAAANDIADGKIKEGMRLLVPRG
jgi:LysM repeat protein